MSWWRRCRRLARRLTWGEGCSALKNLDELDSAARWLIHAKDWQGLAMLRCRVEVRWLRVGGRGRAHLKEGNSPGHGDGAIHSCTLHALLIGGVDDRLPFETLN